MIIFIFLLHSSIFLNYSAFFFSYYKSSLWLHNIMIFDFNTQLSLFCVHNIIFLFAFILSIKKHVSNHIAKQFQKFPKNKLKIHSNQIALICWKTDIVSFFHEIIDRWHFHFSNIPAIFVDDASYFAWKLAHIIMIDIHRVKRVKFPFHLERPRPLKYMYKQ